VGGDCADKDLVVWIDKGLSCGVLQVVGDAQHPEQDSVSTSCSRAKCPSDVVGKLIEIVSDPYLAFPAPELAWGLVALVGPQHGHGASTALNDDLAAAFNFVDEAG
jgi:hypothetical protein